MLDPRKPTHAPFEQSCVCPVIMSNSSVKRWGRKYVEINFAISYSVVTERIQRSTSSTIKNKVGLVRYDKFNTGGFFIWFKICWFRNELREAKPLSPSGHQNWECPLKSPVKNDKYGFSFLILEYKLVTFDRKSKNSGEA